MPPIDTRNDPASTDSEAGEVIPNTLKPDTWRQRKRWSDRFEDPRVIPIPRTLGYEFDPQHLRDLNNILNGGNGCAREGYNAFRMETNWEGYAWGGGGVMAQRSTKSCVNEQGGAGDDETIGTGAVQALLAELPGIVED